MALLAMTEPGDEVLIRIRLVAYPAAVELAGGKAVSAKIDVSGG